ncbi:MAG: hypothetical protein V2B15_12680 [Bacteroidota bacterium]
MKPGRKMMIAVALLFTAMAACANPEKTGTTNETALQLLCSPELTVLANDLADQYMQKKEGVSIQVSEIPENDASALLNEGTIALVRKGSFSGMNDERLFRMVVGRQVIVPVMNVNHPQKDLILQKGITPDQFARIYSSSGMTWGSVLEVEGKNPVRAYMPADACSRSYLAEFILTQPAQINAREIRDPGEMITMIESDPNAIGFCDLTSLVKLEQSGMDAGFCLVPVDGDGDGKLTQFENIYRSCSDLSHGIFIGKYPKALFSKVYAITGRQAVHGEEVTFLEWMITGGQESLAPVSLVKLDYGDRVSGLEHLSALSNPIADLPVRSSSTGTILLVLGIVLTGGILLSLIVKRSDQRDAGSPVPRSPARAVFGKDARVFPAGLFFDKSHTWTFMEKEGNVRIGIDDFIQNVTGSVTRVVMKSPGEKINRGGSLLTLIQKGKQLEIKSPVSGIVVDQNRELLKDASVINADPYNGGWVYLVEPVNWFRELKAFFMGESYADWLKSEFTRLKDFFSAGWNTGNEKEVVAIMQDGGEIREGVLEEFGPRVWEEFQTRFINCS